MRDICVNAAPHEIEEIINDLITIRDTKYLEMRLGVNLKQMQDEIVNKIIEKYSNTNAK